MEIISLDHHVTFWCSLFQKVTKSLRKGCAKENHVVPTQCGGMRAQVETGSAITWKYPSCVLKGDNSVGEFYSVALTNNAQQADTGSKMVHIGKNTRSRIVSKVRLVPPCTFSICSPRFVGTHFRIDVRLGHLFCCMINCTGCMLVICDDVGTYGRRAPEQCPCTSVC